MTTTSDTTAALRVPTVSLNTDIGEGYGAWRIADDESLLSIVTDANIACGFHAGDPDIMATTVRLAVANGVGIGAQVGYHDIAGFGRRFIETPPESLGHDVVYQIGALQAISQVEGGHVGYVKVHGALYHACVARPDYAAAVVGVIASYDSTLPLLCQPGTGLADAAAAAGLDVVAEGYLDRGYTAQGLLVPRDQPGALLSDPDVVARRAVELARSGQVTAVDGRPVTVAAASMCVHSDSPGAVEVARAARSALLAAGVELSPLAASRR